MLKDKNKRLIRILVDDDSVPIDKGDIFKPYGLNNDYYLEDDMSASCCRNGIRYEYKNFEYEFVE